MGKVARCIALLGGSFDPVHQGHVALAQFFIDLLHPDELRVLPAGNPWQKQALQASATQRVEMLQLAFADIRIPLVIDTREITASQPDAAGQRKPTYTIDTLRDLRAELGGEVSLAFLMGADQLRGLHTWHNWRELFDYAHLCVAGRPGFPLALAELDAEVAQAFSQRLATPDQIRTQPHGLACLAPGLAWDVSATDIRGRLQAEKRADSLLAPLVLDYIERHHLYKN